MIKKEDYNKIKNLILQGGKSHAMMITKDNKIFIYGRTYDPNLFLINSNSKGEGFVFKKSKKYSSYNKNNTKVF